MYMYCMCVCVCVHSHTHLCVYTYTGIEYDAIAISILVVAQCAHLHMIVFTALSGMCPGCSWFPGCWPSGQAPSLARTLLFSWHSSPNWWGRLKGENILMGISKSASYLLCGHYGF